MVGEAPHDVESGRYLLIVSYACPWAHRCLMTRAYFGLEKCVPVCSVHPTWGKTKPETDNHSGWLFSDSFERCTRPPNDWFSVRSVYDASGAVNMKKFTVPILWDLKLSTIVNNESSDIIKCLYKKDLLGQYATKNETVDFFPPKQLDKIEETNKWVYDQINNGVYKCGFATTQEAYESAAKELEKGLVRVENILSKSRFLCSDDSLTEADFRLFATLIRHDEVYCVYFKCNHVPIVTSNRFPNIVRYMKELFSLEEIKSTISMEHIKRHYYTSHPKLNPYAIIPVGPNVLNLLES
eukprot:g1815.t1